MRVIFASFLISPSEQILLNQLTQRFILIHSLIRSLNFSADYIIAPVGGNKHDLIWIH